MYINANGTTWIHCFGASCGQLCVVDTFGQQKNCFYELVLMRGSANERSHFSCELCKLEIIFSCKIWHNKTLILDVIKTRLAPQHQSKLDVDIFENVKYCIEFARKFIWSLLQCQIGIAHCFRALFYTYTPRATTKACVGTPVSRQRIYYGSINCI